MNQLKRYFLLISILLFGAIQSFAADAQQRFPKPEFDWDDENLANLQAICPNLFQIFVEDYSPEDEDFDDEDFDDEDEFL